MTVVESVADTVVDTVVDCEVVFVLVADDDPVDVAEVVAVVV